MKSILLTSSSSSSDSSTSSPNSQTSNNLLLLASYSDKKHGESLKEDIGKEILNDKEDESRPGETIFVKEKLLTHHSSNNGSSDKQVIKSNKISSKNNNEKLKRSERKIHSDIECEEKRWQKASHGDVNSDYFSLGLESRPLIETNRVIVNESDNLAIRGEKLIPSAVAQVNSTTTKLINLRTKNGTTLIFQRKNCSQQPQQQTSTDCSEYQELEIESFKKRQSLHWPYKSAISNQAKSYKSRHNSWHDPHNHLKYPFKEEFENPSLAYFEKEHNNLAETLLNATTVNDENVPDDNNIIMKTSIDNSIAATPPTTSSKRWHNIEQFLKSLVGKRSSSPQTPPSGGGTNAVVTSSVIEVNKNPSAYDLLLKPQSQQQKPRGGGSDNSGSSISLNKDRLINNSTTSLNSTSFALVHQKLWSVVPLLSRKDGGGASCNNLLLSNENPSPHGKMRKCETVLVLTEEKQQRKILQASTSTCNRTHSKSINNLLDHPIPIRPLNRLRNSQSCYVNCDLNPPTRQTQTCSRCSSLLSLAAIGGSSYSLKNGAFVLKNGKHLNRHAKRNLLLNEVASEEDSKSSHNLIGYDFNSIEPYETNDAISSALDEQQHINSSFKFTCKLCLGEYYNEEKLTTISSCGCIFCTECMRTYVEFEISEGAYELSCPDALCSSQGVISLAEISQLASTSLVAKHHRYRLNREVELDKNRLWCPNRNCETICSIPTSDRLLPSTSSQPAIQQPTTSSTANLLVPRSVLCPSCNLEFCSSCKKAWHPQISCDENSKRLGSRNDSLMLFDNDLIKMCPMCSVPIEKDEGCAQMMCKRCKHVFCWYCLASLDDDFLLRHYDKGPCKNKLGHSRASVVWHRAQVIGIFAGFGILLLVASPLLLLAAPCIVCCKCKIEESTTVAKLDEPDHHSDHQV